MNGTKFKLEAFVQLRNETKVGTQFRCIYTEPAKEQVAERFKEIQPN